MESLQSFWQSLNKMMVSNRAQQDQASAMALAKQSASQPGHGAPPISEPASQPIRHTGPEVGRNDPCPCGSGKKYKKCCGA
jgi:uncharacterized protein YecA (UPF0149 family)